MKKLVIESNIKLLNSRDNKFSGYNEGKYTWNGKYIHGIACDRIRTRLTNENYACTRAPTCCELLSMLRPKPCPRRATACCWLHENVSSLIHVLPLTPFSPMLLVNPFILRKSVYPASYSPWCSIDLCPLIDEWRVERGTETRWSIFYLHMWTDDTAIIQQCLISRSIIC